MHTYNLILYHVPKHQGISDFMTIRNIMVGRAPDIQVHIVSTAGPVPADFWRTAAMRPTLIFSPAALRLDALAKGTRLISVSLTKLQEVELLANAGFLVPESCPITPETRLDETQWGRFTVIKPNRDIHGHGARLVRTRDVRWSDTTALPKNNPQHNQQLLAQRFVDTGPFDACYRVMTVLGRPIYCTASTGITKRPEFDTAGGAVDMAAQGVARKAMLSNDKDVIELATALHAALPHLPVMGLDIIRERDTGRLFVLGFNSHGLVWHLSSEFGLSQQRSNGIDFYGQFDALITSADALIEATRSIAT